LRLARISAGTLGVGTAAGNTAGSLSLANLTASGTVTAASFVAGVVAIGNSGTTQTIALTSGSIQSCTLTGNCVFTMPTATAGKSFILELATGAGGFTAAFTGVIWPGGTAPAITTAASKVDLISFVANAAGTAWRGNIIQNYPS
jgi:hypothetical protein